MLLIVEALSTWHWQNIYVALQNGWGGGNLPIQQPCMVGHFYYITNNRAETEIDGLCLAAW